MALFPGAVDLPAEGASAEANRRLCLAFLSNPYVVVFLAEGKKMPQHIPDFYALGNEEEAMMLAAHSHYGRRGSKVDTNGKCLEFEVATVKPFRMATAPCRASTRARVMPLRAYSHLIPPVRVASLSVNDNNQSVTC